MGCVVVKRRRLDGVVGCVCGEAGKRNVERGGERGDGGSASFERGVEGDRDRGETEGCVTRDLVCRWRCVEGSVTDVEMFASLGDRGV